MIGEVTEERANGTLEFSVKGGNEDDFFPASVEFDSPETFLKANVGNEKRM